MSPSRTTDLGLLGTRCHRDRLAAPTRSRVPGWRGLALRDVNSIDRMVKATELSIWSRQYAIEVDGRRVTTWDGSWWRAGGTFTLDGRSYSVRGNAWGTEFTMADGTGIVVATAARLGRRTWTVTADGQTYQFRRPSYWRHEERLVVGDREVGTVRRTSMWRSDVEAELPGLPVPAQIFTVAVVLTRWDRDDAAAVGVTP